MPRNKHIDSLIKHSMWNYPAPLSASLTSHPLTNDHKNQLSSSQFPYATLTLTSKVIDRMVTVIPEEIKSQFKKTILVSCQRNIETAVTIYQAMKKLGIRKIYSVGNYYADHEKIKKAMLDEVVCLLPSNKPMNPGEFQGVCRQDIRAMWNRCSKELEDDDVETVIVLDDGGYCLEEMPVYIRLNHRVAGIEQTREGLYSPMANELPFPVIEVASSALKCEIEPILMVKTLIKELEDKMRDIFNKFNFNKKTVIGIIGNGAIGSAVAQYFSSLGYTVVIYDENEDTFTYSPTRSRLYRMPSIEALISNSQCIFGCTGKDALRDISLLDIVTKDTVFIQASFIIK